MTSAIVLISADAEWRAVQALLPEPLRRSSSLGEWFVHQVPVHGATHEVIFFHGGWGKVAAAASAQYVIDRWQPDLLVNLGTCGGFAGEIERGTILLVERALVYDIIEQMGDNDAHIAHYTTDLDLSWLKGEAPIAVRRSVMVSGDRDLLPEDIPMLRERFGAVAGDWESAAIAYVAKRNRTRLLILRGVSDVVGAHGSEAYGNLPVFELAAREVLGRLIESLPGWLEIAIKRT